MYEFNYGTDPVYKSIAIANERILALIVELLFIVFEKYISFTESNSPYNRSNPAIQSVGIRQEKVVQYGLYVTKQCNLYRRYFARGKVQLREPECNLIERIKKKN